MRCELLARLEENLKQDPQLEELKADVRDRQQKCLSKLMDARQRLTNSI